MTYIPWHPPCFGLVATWSNHPPSSSAVCGRAVQFLQAFLCGHTRSVKVRTCLNAPRNVTEGVQQGCVFGPLLFKTALTSLPWSFLQPTDATVHFALYADDNSMGNTPLGVLLLLLVALLCALHCSVASTGLFSMWIKLAVSLSKAVIGCYFCSRHLPPSRSTLFYSGRPICRVLTLTYLSPAVDDKANWVSAAKSKFASCQQLLCILRRLCPPS